MSETHGALMDQVYRRQRYFYDATRAYYLLGRDHLVSELKPADHAHILEIACGTGRNLSIIDRHYPNRHLYGLDISKEMLRSAAAKLGDKAALALGDACDFDPQAMFGHSKFDHIVMSYSLSMIPNWRSAITMALSHLGPGGVMHIVDFGDQSRLPRWFDRGLRSWLGRFHVAPRDSLKVVLTQIDGTHVEFTSLYRTYAQYAKIRIVA